MGLNRPGLPLPSAVEARLDLLSRRLAERGYHTLPLPDDARPLSPCRRGPVIATVARDGQRVGNVVQYGDRLTASGIQADDPLHTDIEDIWASPEWRERFGSAVAVPRMPQGERANLSAPARAYLAAVGAPDPDASPHAAALIWHHALAIGYSPAYLREHGEAIRGDWPRVPLPAGLDDLMASARLGQRVAVLLDDVQAPTDEVPAHIGRLEQVADGHGYEVRAGWGAKQREGAVMPGRGRLTERQVTDLPEPLGDRAVDVWLNDGWYWADVPLRVWELRVGGYQVFKKWLSYREFGVLGRALTADEVQEATGIVHRLTALVLLEPELDGSYQRCRSRTWQWQREEAPPALPLPERSPPPDPVWKPEDPVWASAYQRVQSLIEEKQIAIHGPVAVSLTPEAREALAALRRAGEDSGEVGV